MKTSKKTTNNKKTKSKSSVKQPHQSKSDSRDKLTRKPEEKELALRFSPTAWAKLLYFRDKADNEVGGFGISLPGDLLFITEFVTVKQNVTSVSIEFDDAAVSDFFDRQVDLGRKPEQFGRIWIHSHPFDSAEPSLTDEETFKRVFGRCQWAVMLVVAQENHVHSRLRFNVGPGGEVLVPVRVDYNADFGPSDKEAWELEYRSNINVENIFGQSTRQEQRDSMDDYAFSREFLEEFEEMEPAERQFVLNELGARPDLWDDESGVMF